MFLVFSRKALQRAKLRRLTTPTRKDYLFSPTSSRLLSSHNPYFRWPRHVKRTETSAAPFTSPAADGEDGPGDDPCAPA